MPDIPLPEPAPTQPDNTTLSGGTWVSGAGFDQASGTPVDYAEYRQWMTIEYTRNPRQTTDASSGNTIYRSLAQLSSTDGKQVTNTGLHFNITVHNSCTFLSGTYDLSASYQAQKFVLMAEKFDKVGYSYGEVTGSSNLYVFGPQGTLLTSQPYVRRKALESTDVEYSYTQVATSNAYAVSGPLDNGCNPWTWGAGDDIGQPYSDYLMKSHDIAAGTNFPISSKVAGDTFYMYGGQYATTSEVAYGDNAAGLQRMIAFIENNCAYLASPNSGSRFPVPLPTNSDGYATILEADRLAINPYYSTAFHDYS